MDYVKLLRKARKELPDTIVALDRFEVPKARGHLEGNKTIITNFLSIANTLRREPKHLLKYILKELATPGIIKGQTVVLKTKVAASRINERIQSYAREYVLCRECGKPDSTIDQEGNFSFVKCLACGARHGVKSRI
jgi:translation initiation factor 2 subunit 2